MDYREFLDRLDHLKRHQAPQYVFEELLNDFRRRGYGDYSRDPYGREASLGAMYGRSPAMDFVDAARLANPPIVLTKENAMATTSDIKPITNVAIKLLVDQLASKKNVRSAHENANEVSHARIKVEKDKIAARGKYIETADKEISELTKALKKLGHTIEK